MNIFCKETQAQLELHPHLQSTSLPESLCKTIEPNLPLITPDLWLRDCHSPPLQPLDDRSPSPQRLRSSPSTGPVASQLRVSNKLFDRQSRKRKRTPLEDTAPNTVYPEFTTRAPLCRSPAFTQSQTTNNNTPTSDLPPPLYPLNMQQSLLPPPMILVPYPIMLPIPIPIPIPIPLPFLRKECDNTNKERSDNKS